MNKKFYTGVGARKTPIDVLQKMVSYAGILEFLGFTLRSGGQPKGADGAFEQGVKHRANKVIYKPNHWVGGSLEPKIIEKAYMIAAKHHPAWLRLEPYVKKLMARNVHAVLGDELNSPSRFVICWTPDGMNNYSPRTSLSGGTGHTLAVALENSIPIYNLKNEEDEKDLDDFIVSIINKNFTTVIEKELLNTFIVSHNPIYKEVF